MIQEELGIPDLPPATAEKAKHGNFTGVQLKAEAPALCAKIVELFDKGHGLSVLKISQLTGVSRNTITALLDLEGVMSVEQLRKQVGRSSLQAAAHLVDRVMEDPDAIPKAQLGMTAKLLGDMAMTMTGQATQRIELLHTVRVEPSSMLERLQFLKDTIQMGPETVKILPNSDQLAAIPATILEAEIVDQVATNHATRPVE